MVVQNVRKIIYVSVLTKVAEKYNTSIIIDSEGFVHIFDIFVS